MHNSEKRFEAYHQVKKISTEAYVKEKFRLFVLWRLTSDHSTKRCFNFPNSETADAFLAKWLNGDFNVPRARGTIFSKPPGLCIDQNRFIWNFFFSLKRGLRKECVQAKLYDWFSDRVSAADNVTFQDMCDQVIELEKQRKSEKKERKRLKQLLLTSMQQHLIDNIRLHLGN